MNYRKSAFKGGIESLEARNLMTATINRDAIWEIQGTDASDKIVIEDDLKHPGYLLARNGGDVIGRAVASALRKIRVYAGVGDDTVVIKASGFYYKGDTKNYSVAVLGEAGNDKIISTSATLVADGGAGDDSIYGTVGNDILTGGDGNDSILGDNGKDSIVGGDGDDRLFGGYDNDIIIGGLGRDHEDGGMGRDWIDGSAGKDSLYGGNERDTLIGGKHGDLLERDNRRDEIPAKPEDAVVIASTNPDWRKQTAAFSRNNYAQSTRGGYLTYFNGGFASIADSDFSVVRTATSGSLTIVNSVHSDTNVQVSGIDEADTLETDGNFIYSVVGNSIVITDVSNPAAMKVVSETKYDGNIQGLYLDGNKLTVVWSRYESIQTGTNGGGRLAYFSWIPGIAKTVVTTLDVTDRSAPAQTSETTIDGGYVTSRYQNGQVYLVTTHYEQIPLLGGDYVEGVWIPESEESYQTRLAAAAAVNGAAYSVTANGKTTNGGLGEVAEPVDTGILGNPGSTAYVTLIDTNLPGSAPIDSKSFSGTNYFNSIYMTANSIYLAETDYQKTHITKLGIGTNELTIEGDGDVEGFVNGQFAFDETAGGYLRVTSQVEFGRTATTNFTILQDEGSALNVVSQLKGLAPGETLYATRYIGDRAYFITYGPDWSKIPRFTDPLFVVDASDPEKPKSLGELKIPGYSQYLQPADETHLIGLGQRDDDADGNPDGLQLSLFDVADPSKPKRVGTYDFGFTAEQDWSASSAMFNHLAFTYMPGSKLLAVPFSSGKRGSGVEVLKVNLDKGFDYVTTVANKETDWAELRGVFASNSLFAVGLDKITSVSLLDTTIRGSVDLPEQPNDPNDVVYID